MVCRDWHGICYILGMKLTMKRVNEALKPLGVYLCKGNGYFYFWSDTAGHAILRAYSSSVAVCKLSNLSIDQWVSQAQRIIAETVRFE